jgi:hypothetical protein
VSPSQEHLLDINAVFYNVVEERHCCLDPFPPVRTVLFVPPIRDSMIELFPEGYVFMPSYFCLKVGK